MARRDFGFGGASSRQRRDADLFYADLVGPTRARGAQARRGEQAESFAEWFGEAVPACPPPGPIPATCLGITTREVVDCFDLGSATVLPRHQPKLINIARCILAARSTATPITSLQLVGHADPSGAATPNTLLGQRRADAVKASLQATLIRMTGGSPPAVTLTTSSRGELDPLPAGAAASRRVEIIAPFAFTPGVPTPVAPPATTPPAPPVPPFIGAPFRPCCMLDTRSLIDSSPLAPHSDFGGIIYTGGAGFFDLGHVRDVADLTGFVYQQIHAASGATGTSITTTEGTATLSRTLAPAEWLEVARSIAFDDSHAHEISSYDSGKCGELLPSPGAHNSSFSPEDLCSNFLGTLVAERALRVGGTFATEVERQIVSLLTSLAAQPLAATRAAFALIDGNWVRSGSSALDNCYLQRRNFSRTPVKAGHSSDVTTPAFVTAPFTVSPAPYDYLNRTGFRLADFPTRIAAIRADARTRYGASFELP
jgi:outer membrane protein OmpA-like peptidoglycan-associated protein